MPDLRWSAFDAVVCPEGDRASAYFVAPSHLERATLDAGGRAPPVLGRGRRPELAALPVRFATRVPAMLGYPELGANDAECYMLKPDGAAPAATRAVVKCKIEEFDEARFDASAAWDATRRLTLEELGAWARRMVNPARVASARSKVGRDPAAVRDEVALDVLVDLGEAFPAAMARSQATRRHGCGG